jgi:sulfoxide reductase heme-binding subunit YedZ
VTPTQAVRWIGKPAAFVAALWPAGWLVWAIATGNLSVNPLSDITNHTGLWTLRFLCITLLVSPLRRITGWNLLIRFRRMIGLFAFFYGTLHMLTYVIADRFTALEFPGGVVSWSTVLSWTTAVNLAVSVSQDVYERPFITIGFTAFVCMVPLAVTSTAGMIRRLGGRRWQMLHRLVYVSAAAGVVHYWWLVKADVTSPQRYAVVVGLLLAARIYWARAGAPRRTPSTEWSSSITSR